MIRAWLRLAASFDRAVGIPAASAITRISERMEQTTNQSEQAGLAYALDVITDGADKD